MSGKRTRKPSARIGWAPGQSGNPGGKIPPTPNLREAFRVAMDKSLDAVNRLVELMTQTEDLDIAFKASKELLDRAMGRPAQSLHVTEQQESQDIANRPRAERIALLEEALKAEREGLSPLPDGESQPN